MCAINPVHKKRIILDVYTSDKNMSEEEFTSMVLEKCFQTEMRLNEDHRLRWHIKETDQGAE